MQAGDAVLRVLEVEQLVAHTLSDENTACVLVDDGLLVL
jgi:hypothetical protein